MLCGPALVESLELGDSLWICRGGQPKISARFAIVDWKAASRSDQRFDHQNYSRQYSFDRMSLFYARKLEVESLKRNCQAAVIYS